MNLEPLKAKIWEYMSGRYRTGVKDIAAELRQPVRRVRKALELLMAEGRIFSIVDEGNEVQYRCLFEQPAWIKTVMEAAVCDGSPGLSYHYVGEDHQLMVYPTPFIREGHESEGIHWMSHWNIQVSELLGLFDDRPHVVFGEADGTAELSLEGNIAGVDVWIEFCHRPPENSLPLLLLNEQGDFRELSEDEMADYESTYMNDDEETGEEESPIFNMLQLWKPSDN